MSSRRPATSKSAMASAGAAVVSPAAARPNTTTGVAPSVASRRSHAVAQPVLHSYLDARAMEETTNSPVLRRTRTRDHRGLKKLLEKAAPVDVDYRGMTALHHAAAIGDVSAMKLLLQKGGKRHIEAKDRCGSTPLHHAALLNHTKAVKLLLRAKADINAQKANGRTALHEAAWIGHMEVLEVLIHARADPFILEANHRTASQLARMNHADPAAERIDAYIAQIRDEEYRRELARRNGEWKQSFVAATAKRRDCGRSKKKRTEPTAEELEALARRRKQREEAAEKRRLREERTRVRALWLAEQKKLAAGVDTGGSSRASSVCSYAMTDSELSERGLERGTFTCHCPYCTLWRKSKEMNEWDAHALAQLG